MGSFCAVHRSRVRPASFLPPRHSFLGITALVAVALAAMRAPAFAHPPLAEDIEEATEAIQSAAHPAAQYLARGELYRLDGNWEAARADYDRAATLDPRLPGIALCRATLLFDQHRLKEAYAAVGDLLAREPGDPGAWMLRSRASEALGRPGEAAADLGRAIEATADPTADLYVERSRLLVTAGSKAVALQSLDEGIARLGPIVSLELAAVELERGRGNTAAALARLDRVAAQMARPQAILEQKAQILANAGDAAGARRILAATAAHAAPDRTRQWFPGGSGQVFPLPAPTPEAATLRDATPPTAERAAANTGQAAPAQALVNPVVTRGPYLQIGTPSSITIRWRTDQFATSRVQYGTAVGSLTSNVDNTTLTTEHEITINGLAANQRYYYSIGTTTLVLEGNDASHTFLTSPTPGTTKPTRLWIIGDSGTADAGARAVRDAFVSYTGSRQADVWLMLGDNAYSSGTDTEYQAAVFDMYPAILKNTVLWPTRGNHDTVGSAFDYYDIFSLPKSGQAGGLASGSEAYYSFDYANVHLICLDSQGSDRSPGGAMASWLKNDLAATTQDWVIAYWHHPPYTKGSHDSDTESQLIDMRQNILPILEAAGVDIVFTGHSHDYERSFLLDGHYGISTTLTAAMKIDPGDGRESGTGAYQKATLGTGPHEGCVYTVAGSSGHTGGGSLDHPVMITSQNVMGSVVVDVSGSRLDARFLDSHGAVKDNFTILKGSGAPRPDTTPPAAITNLGVDGTTTAASPTGAVVKPR